SRASSMICLSAALLASLRAPSASGACGAPRSAARNATAKSAARDFEIAISPPSPLPGRASEFDHIALGIIEIDREAEAARAVADAKLAHLDAVRREMGADGRLVKRADGKTEMIEIAPLLARRAAAAPAKLAVHGDKVDQRVPGAHRVEAALLLRALKGAAEHIAVKGDHRRRILNAEHDMIHPDDLQRGPSFPYRLFSRFCPLMQDVTNRHREKHKNNNRRVAMVTREDLIGSWELVSWRGIKNGEPIGYPMGEDALGQVI